MQLQLSNELSQPSYDEDYTVRASRPASPLEQVVPSSQETPQSAGQPSPSAPPQTGATPEAILRRAQLNLLSPYRKFTEMALGYAPPPDELQQLWQEFRQAGTALPTAGQGAGPQHLDEMARARQWQALANATTGGVPNTMTQGDKLMGALNAYNMQGHKEVADLAAAQKAAAAKRYEVAGDMLGKQGDLLKAVLAAARSGVTAESQNKFQFDYVPGVGYMRADPMTGEATMLHRAFHGKDIAKLYEDLAKASEGYDFLGACKGDQACAAQLKRRWLEQELDKRINQFGFNRPNATPQVPAAGATFENPDIAMQLLSALRTGQPIIVEGQDVTEEVRQQLAAAGYPAPGGLPAAARPPAPAPVPARPPAPAHAVQPPLLDPTKEKQRTAEAEAVAKSSAEFSGLIDDRVSVASRNMELIKKLESLGDPFTNPLADYMTAAGGFLQQLGANGDLIKMATTTGQVSQVVNDLVAAAQLAQKGVQTDKDAERYAKAQIDYRWNTPDGYRLNLRYLRAMNDYQLYQGRVRDEYKGGHRDSTIGFATSWAEHARKDPMSAYYVNPSADREIKQQSIDMRSKGVLKNAKEQDRWIESQRRARQQLIFRNEFIQSYLSQFHGKTLSDAEAAWRKVAKE